MEKQITYKTKQEAKAACEEYEAELEKLQSKLGVAPLATSTCGDTFIIAAYLNEWTGATEEFWHPIG